MGVYHLMGLGQSVGAVTGPLSYLARRFERWDDGDRDFFSLSGELEHRQQGKKVGEVQAVVLFTTLEVLNGERKCLKYIENQPGLCPASDQQAGGEAPIRDALRRLLPPIWRKIAKGRRTATVYWAEVDRTNLLGLFQRAAAVIRAARSPGSLGKEIWVNLTGGNNVTQFALQLATELTGTSERHYYVQAANQVADKCVHFTREEGYWVDLPLLPMRAYEASRKVVELVSTTQPLETQALFTRLKTEHWRHFSDEESVDEFRRSHVRPLVFQGLLARDGDLLRVGPRWHLVKPFYDTLDGIGLDTRNLDQLTSESWFTKEELPLR